MNNVKILIIHGANMDQLGTEPQQINGSVPLNEIENNLQLISQDIKVELLFFHSNIEGELVNRIHQAKAENVHGILINAGSYSQTSIAISDAIKSAFLPAVEILFNNITIEKDTQTVISPSCIGLISGFGPFAYHLGLLSLHNAIMEIKTQQEMQEQQMQQQQMPLGGM